MEPMDPKAANFLDYTLKKKNNPSNVPLTGGVSHSIAAVLTGHVHIIKNSTRNLSAKNSGEQQVSARTC